METFIALGFLKIEFKKPLMLSIRGFFLARRKSVMNIARSNKDKK